MKEDIFSKFLFYFTHLYVDRFYKILILRKVFFFLFNVAYNVEVGNFFGIKIL